MNKHLLYLLFFTMLCASWAQTPSVRPPQPFNPPTLAVLLANRPAHIESAEWLRMMEDPVNRSLFPLRITQATLDTLDGTQLDRRFQYILMR
jgi:hypothetical protein